MRTQSNRQRMAKRLAVAALTTAVTAGLSVAPAGVTPTATASGYNNQYQHTQVRGDRGSDVKALQYMLMSRGFSAGATDGSFGPATQRAVKRFQKAKRLKVDGIVGPSTWKIMHITTGANRGGFNDTKALQFLLQQKHRSSLKVDGKFGPRTKDALRSFQRAHSLKVDGVATDNDWSKLLGHFERANSSVCHYFSNTSNQWATSQSMGIIEDVSRSWNTSRYGKASLGNSSRTHGGKLSPHSSHQVGLDVDMAAFMTNKRQCTYTVTWRSGSYDRTATRKYIQQLRASGRVKLVFFNDPVLIREGLTKYASGHDNHFHVRFREQGFRHGRFDYR